MKKLLLGLAVGVLLLGTCCSPIIPPPAEPSIPIIEEPAPLPSAPELETPSGEHILSSDIDFAVFTDPIGKFSVEYPHGWFIDEVSGEDEYNLHLSIVAELNQRWEDEYSLFLGYWFHSSESSSEAEFSYRQWTRLAIESKSLISMSGPNSIEDLSYWEFKETLGEKVSGNIYCDWEDGLLHISYDFPQSDLAEMETDIMNNYALRMLSTFCTYGPRLSEREINILKLVNVHRQQNGLCALELNEFMSTLAREHSDRQSMLNPISFSDKKGLGISHIGFDGRAERIFLNLGASIVGENVAMGYDTSASLVEAWLSSPGHRDNIMNPAFRRTGIGLAGSIATQIFSD